MIRLTEIKLPLRDVPAPARRPAQAAIGSEADDVAAPHPEALLREQVLQRLGVPSDAIAELQVFKRSFDARGRDVHATYIVDIVLRSEALEKQLLAQFEQHPHVQPTPDMRWSPPPGIRPNASAPRPVVVGFGPCGMLAALCLAQMGLRPIVIERGPMVRQRTQDTWGLWRKKQLKTQSNVQFGEGGAGTFSDGKLYSQIKDPRHLGRKVLHEFVQAGAPADILYAAHPHIGTFKLVKVVENIRARILELGGELRFNQQLVGLQSEQGRLQAADIHDLSTDQHYTQQTHSLVLALGHSARDTFAQLYDQGIAMQAKPFSVGVRIEHPQSLIDRARWGQHAGHPLLGAADYKLVHHASNGRTVYSFCMCPGGTVVAATSEAGRVVTNGMSQYSRNERNANAGMVVGVEPEDFPLDPALWTAAFGAEDGARWLQQAQTRQAQGQAAHPLAGIVFQRHLESLAFVAGGSDYCAPAQRVGDFLQQRASAALGEVLPSYKPGVRCTDIHRILPDYACTAMREALPAFGKKIKGYDLPDALLTGVETRTSSPLRIDRDAQLQSPSLIGLYPAGEGAGYAGGILSAAVDGIRVAEALAQAHHSA